jgi:hypothetical protein
LKSNMSVSNDEFSDEIDDDLSDLNNTLKTLLNPDFSLEDSKKDLDNDDSTDNRVSGIRKSIQASSEWQTEMELVEAMYPDLIFDIKNDSDNRSFKIIFIAALFKEKQKDKLEQLHEDIDTLERQLLIAKRQNIKKVDIIVQKISQCSNLIREYSQFKPFPRLVVTFRMTRRYPYVPIDLDMSFGGELDCTQIFTIQRMCQKEMKELYGGPMIFAIIDKIQQLYDDYLPAELDQLEKLQHDNKKLVDLAKSKYNIDVTRPQEYVGNINDHVRRLDPRVQVVNAENVLRADLAVKFERYRRYLSRCYLEGTRNKHRRTTCDWVDPMVVFHGTRAENVGSIVTSGLVVPDGNKVSVASGSRYGLGIYTSPDINFSLHYTRGTGRLLVCAVLPGHKFICNDNNVDYAGGCTKGYDSHFSEDRTELVLFKACQVLPCYVLHYKYRSLDIEKPIEGGYRNLVEEDDPVMAWKAKKKKKQDELRSIAMKNLGYGFGPAGAKFVVEAVIGPRFVEEEIDTFDRTHENQYQRDRGTGAEDPW